MLGTSLDKLISFFSPSWAIRRAAHRASFSRIEAAASGHKMMEKMLGKHSGGYEAGRRDRLRGRRTGSPHENDVPREQIEALRWRSWNLYRNCGQARKICRTLGAKVIGRGLSPQPQAVHEDKTAFVEFRKRAMEVWAEWGKECDFRGKPGAGGQSLAAICKTALRATSLSGGALYRFRHLDRTEQRKKDLLLPLQVQMMHVDRVDRQKHGDGVWNGVKLDDEGRVVGYYILRGGIETEDAIQEDSVFVPVADVRHLYAEDDIDQVLGSPWLGAALLTMDDRRSYEHHELTAAEMGSCLVAGYRRSSGHAGGIGLQVDNDRDLVDADGNPVTHLQPGMLLDLGTTGSFETINPTRPNNSAGEFLSHLIRSEASGVPGVKASTLSGDYRQSSFSSERSADNDVWPEIEELQDWFSSAFCQPVYEVVITTAVLAGLFDDIEGFDAAVFRARRRDHLKANWQGPVARSINPKDDALAAKARIQGGTSSPQREAAQIGRDWREIVQEYKEYIDYCDELEIPEEVRNQSLGIEKAATPDEPPADAPDDDNEVEDTAARGDEQDATSEEDDATTNRFRNSGFVSMNSV